jgi:hypothetical protein
MTVLLALIALMPLTNTAVRGSYVEARSASVYAGACHYNAEVTTAGRQAVLAWKISTGVSNHISLDGLSVVAVISGETNLAEPNTPRRTVLYLDQKATEPQQRALTALFSQRVKAAFGEIVAVKRASISISESSSEISVDVAAHATLIAKKYPCEHCRMPAQQWYDPLAPTITSEVAQSVQSGFTEKTLGLSWTQEASDNVFVGAFRF